MSLETAIERVLKRAESIPGLAAVLLTGSAARGELLPNSDYDFLVLIEDHARWPMAFRDGGRESYIDDEGRQVEIGFGSVKRARAKIAETVAVGVPIRAEALVEARVLLRRGDAIDVLLDEARSVLDAGPPAIEYQDLLWECYDVWNQMKDLIDVSSDDATAALIAAPLFEHLLRFYFRLERRWLPRPRAMMPALCDADPEYHALALAYVGSATAGERIATLQSMMDYLARRFDLTFEAAYVSTR
jgi:predicted nucleotidyltransferase